MNIFYFISYLKPCFSIQRSKQQPFQYWIGLFSQQQSQSFFKILETENETENLYRVPSLFFFTFFYQLSDNFPHQLATKNFYLLYLILFAMAVAKSELKSFGKSQGRVTFQNFSFRWFQIENQRKKIQKYHYFFPFLLK